MLNHTARLQRSKPLTGTFPISITMTQKAMDWKRRLFRVIIVNEPTNQLAIDGRASAICFKPPFWSLKKTEMGMGMGMGMDMGMGMGMEMEMGMDIPRLRKCMSKACASIICPLRTIQPQPASWRWKVCEWSYTNKSRDDIDWWRWRQYRTEVSWASPIGWNSFLPEEIMRQFLHPHPHPHPEHKRNTDMWTINVWRNHETISPSHQFLCSNNPTSSTRHSHHSHRVRLQHKSPSMCVCVCVRVCVYTVSWMCMYECYICVCTSQCV